MFLLFQQHSASVKWIFTGTFETQRDAVTYAQEHFDSGDVYTVCEQSDVPLRPSWCQEI